MGFDLYIKTYITGNIIEFFKVLKDELIIKYGNEILQKEYDYFKKMTGDNGLKFFNKMEGMFDNNYDMEIPNWHFPWEIEGPLDSDDENYFDYYSLEYVAIQFILDSYDNKDENWKKYIKIFDGSDDISIEDDVIKICLNYESSYKGSDEIVIDFMKIGKKIENLKLRFTFMEQHSILGID